jgi:uncharacterized protein
MHLRLLSAISTLCVVSACQQLDRSPLSVHEYQAIETTVSSRGALVPVSFVYPVTSADKKFPFVVMAHGHASTRHEAGGFTRMAEGLAARGIASIRMDFPGCGGSEEPFTSNNLGNMLDDIRASRDFAVTRQQIDKNRVGLLGFSMGGRLALMLSSRQADYQLIALWAPAGSNGAKAADSLVGTAGWQASKSRAVSEGFYPVTTSWGRHLQLGPEWITDIEESRPLDTIREFQGPLLVLYGDLDEVLPPRIPEQVISAATNSTEVVRHVVRGAGHGLGLFHGNTAATDEAVKATVDFFAQHLTAD